MFTAVVRHFSHDDLYLLGIYDVNQRFGNGNFSDGTHVESVDLKQGIQNDKIIDSKNGK